MASGFVTEQNLTVPFPTGDAGGYWLTGGAKHQTGELDLVVNYKFAQAEVGKPMTLWASLEGTSVRPGAMADDADDAVGYFQQRVDVTMTLGLADGVAGHESVDYFLRVSDGPATYSGSGSVSSSVSISLSGNINAGFFGGVPTGGVGVGGSITDSHSFSQTLQDFEVTNNSNSQAAKHSYAMAKSSGAAYKNPEDLIPDLSIWDRFKPIKLYRPPALATANLPILSQIIWQASDLTSVFRPHRIFITIYQSVAWVTATNEFFDVQPGHLTGASEWTRTVDIPFDQFDHQTV